MCGEDTPVCICRELTKLHEEVLRGTAKQAFESFAGRDAVKGEFAVVFYPQEKTQIMDEAEIAAALKLYLEKGMTCLLYTSVKKGSAYPAYIRMRRQRKTK